MRTLRPVDLERIEREHPRGIPARHVVRLFQERGVRLSEGTFRKYVQVGLLPRSRRVGRKGKHRGSEGLYPVSVVRRIEAIKSMMGEGMTLGDIRDSFLLVRGDIEVVEREIESVVERLVRTLAQRPLPRVEHTRLSAELRRLRREATRLTEGLERIGSRIAAAGPASGERRPVPEGA